MNYYKDVARELRELSKFIGYETCDWNHIIQKHRKDAEDLIGFAPFISEILLPCKDEAFKINQYEMFKILSVDSILEILSDWSFFKKTRSLPIFQSPDGSLGCIHASPWDAVCIYYSIEATALYQWDELEGYSVGDLLILGDIVKYERLLELILSDLSL
jgi:hypothetical protein